MKTKNLFSIILTLCIVSTSFFSAVQASAKTEEIFNQPTYEVKNVDDRMQTYESPVETIKELGISNKDDFNAFMATPKYHASNYKITLNCDIDMQGIKLNPIEEFNGIFDGSGHTVSNLSMKDMSSKGKNSELAFIKTLNSSAEIKNITFDNYTIIGKIKFKKVAGLVCTNYGTISDVKFTDSNIVDIIHDRATGFVFSNTQDGVIENCTINIKCKSNIKSGFVVENSGSISNCQIITNTSKGNSGFVYTNKNTGKIINSSTNLTVNCGDKIVGGFVNENEGTIENCNSKCNVLGSKYVGGFCGKNLGNISSCKSYGLVESSTQYKTATTGGFVAENVGIIEGSSSIGKSVIGREYVGGFCGNNNEKGEIISCNCSFKKVEAKTYFNKNCCGGFVGKNSGIITQKCKASNEKVKGEECAGGFCGENLGSISSCNAENRNSTAETKCNNNICGGFVGKNKSIVKDCTAKGKVNAQECAGGFCGENSGNISSCESEGSTTAATQSRTAKAGGFVSENKKGTINNCTSKGNVVSISDNFKAKAGGFVGINKAKIEKSTVSDCHVYLSVGICYKELGCGGFVGKNAKGGNIEECNLKEFIVKTYNGEKGGWFVGEAENESIIKKCSREFIIGSGTTESEFYRHKDNKAIIEND